MLPVLPLQLSPSPSQLCPYKCESGHAKLPFEIPGGSTVISGQIRTT